MKRILLQLLLLITTLGHAQVGVNTTTPDPSSMLDIASANKGVLVPRVSLPNVTTTQLDGTNTAATGLLIWNTNAATTGGNGVGFYFFNGTQWMPITQSGAADLDIYEVGGTTAPDAITDNKYTQGTLTIGTNTAATGIFDIDNATKTTSIGINNTFATNPVGVNVDISSANSAKTGVKTTFNGASATGSNTFISNIDNTTGNNNRNGILQEFNGSSASISTNIRGVKNDFKSTANYYAVIYGFENSFADNTNSFKYGLTNNFLNGGSSQSTGVLNNFNGTSTGIAYGVYNASNNYNGYLYGMQNIFSGTGNNDHYGMYNYLEGTGTGNKYGVYNYFPTTAGGTHYRIYSEILKSGSYAGYFLGNVAIGTTIANHYTLPPSRGTNGQTMQTDAAGNVSWVTPAVVTDTDDQAADVFSLTGSTLNLSLQNDGVATQTVDLSPLKDHDWYETGGTTQPNAITDNKYTLGTITVGSNSPATAVLDVDNSTKLIGLDVSNSFTSSPMGINVELNSTSTSKVGLNIDLKGVNTSSVSTIINNRDECATTGNFWGIYQTFVGSNTSTSNAATGIRNWFTASSGYQGSLTGTSNEIFNNLNGIHYGNYNFLNGTGTGNKYGTYNQIDNFAGGTHYGLYSEVLKTGSYAGYFLGRVSIGTSTVNNYILPAARGANGQTMQTDGSGNVTWVNPVDTDTDNQQIDVLGLVGDTLTISLQDDAVATQTLNLSSIDNQATDVFSLTGTTLNLSLQNDGVATQTVDLSSLKDADWYEVGGTTPADAITDNIYTSGDVSIGKSTAATGKLDISNSTKLNSLVIDNTTATAGIKSGISNSITIQSANNASSAITNTISGTAISKSGVSNSFANANASGILFEYANSNYFASTGNTSGFGSINYFSPTANNSGQAVGLRNEVMSNNSAGTFVGVENETNNNTNGFQIGVDNLFNGGGTGGRYGTNNNFFGSASGEIVGTQTNIQTTGTGVKYGEKIIISPSAGGTHYGIFSDVTKANSFAGFFKGNLSVGTSLLDNYIFPASRGTNGQIMQTDGSGNVSWVDNAASDADWYEVGGTSPANSILDNIFTGGDVSIGKATAATGKVDIEADNKTSTLVLENNNATTGIKYGIENNLTLNTNNIFSAGLINKMSGNAPFKFGITNYYTSNNTGASITEVGYNTDYTSTGNVNFVGHSNSIFPSSTNSGSITGYVNSVTGSATGAFIGFQNSHFIANNNSRIGLLNTIGGSGSGDIMGTSNSFTGSSSGEIIGISTSITSTGTGLKYGEKIVIDNTSGGIHCGIYADVTKANSYAGYFLGRVSIGNTLVNNYILPASRGTNGQIMQTDGAGNVSWVNPTFTDTDDQTIDVLSLTGDTLNISLQDDGVATQTLNLGTIDNQATDVFSLTGNTLNLSLQNDGVATQTVDLSSLANDWKLTGNAGTVSGTNFIGTTDAEDLDFRVNNTVKIRLTQQGQLSFVNAGGSVFVGINAGDNDDLSSNQNTFVGSTSGELTTTGNLNTAIGHASLNANLTGQGNSGLGKSSLLTNTTGSNNTGVGRLADVATFGLSNATAVGYNATVSASDKVRLGNTTVTVIEGQVPYTNPSDARFKFNVQDNVPGLDFITKLKPVTYHFDTKKFDEHLNRNRNRDDVANEDFTESTAIVRTGFLAQEVEKICIDLGYKFDGLHIPDANNPADNYGIAYSQFIMPIVKAVQEQQVIIETQKAELEQLKSELDKYKQLEERIKALEAK